MEDDNYLKIFNALRWQSQLQPSPIPDASDPHQLLLLADTLDGARGALKVSSPTESSSHENMYAARLPLVSRNGLSPGLGALVRRPQYAGSAGLLLLGAINGSILRLVVAPERLYASLMMSNFGSET